MPKAKLKVAKDDFKKLQVAAEIAGGKLIAEQTRVIGDEAIVMTSCPNTGMFFEMGKLFKSVTGNELDNQPVPVEKKKTEKPTVKA